MDERANTPVWWWSLQPISGEGEGKHQNGIEDSAIGIKDVYGYVK